MTAAVRRPRRDAAAAAAAAAPRGRRGGRRSAWSASVGGVLVTRPPLHGCTVLAEGTAPRRRRRRLDPRAERGGCGVGGQRGVRRRRAEVPFATREREGRVEVAARDGHRARSLRPQQRAHLDGGGVAHREQLERASAEHVGQIVAEELRHHRDANGGGGGGAAGLVGAGAAAYDGEACLRTLLAERRPRGDERREPRRRRLRVAPASG